MMALFSIGNIDYSHGQTYSTTSKSCENCGRIGSTNSKKGDRCPLYRLISPVLKRNFYINVNQIH